MKTALASLTALALLGAPAPTAQAGQREWATAGKVLTGVVAGAVLVKALEPVPVYQAPPPTVVYAPVPAPAAVVVQPAPVVVQPAPVVIYQQPVYIQPAPVYVAPAPVYVAAAPVWVPRAPVVSFHIGFGPRHHAFHHRRACW